MIVSAIHPVLEAMYIAGDEDEENKVRDLAPEDAARLRSQMEELLQHGGKARAAAASDEEAMRYGREMWARCEALTAGLLLYQLCTFMTVCAAVGTCRGSELGSGAQDFMHLSGLAGELTEQLRLILEPTKATRLAGEYRSGKRLAMRKVIAYIASHFRKDKIWLRRTRPDQRTYQVRTATTVSILAIQHCHPPVGLCPPIGKHPAAHSLTDRDKVAGCCLLWTLQPQQTTLWSTGSFCGCNPALDCLKLLFCGKCGCCRCTNIQVGLTVHDSGSVAREQLQCICPQR